MKILILGASSFAAAGLAEQLEKHSHEVWTFDRQPRNNSPRSLGGAYENLAEFAKPMGSCDALINFALVKFGDLESNQALLDQIIKAATALSAGCFVQISSISVLPSVKGVLDESAPAVSHQWKGSYSKVKAAAEIKLRDEWTRSPLIILRPGFILAENVIDPMVGIGMRLPTAQVLGLGNANTIIPLVERSAVHEGIGRLMNNESLRRASACYMLVAPNAPKRRDYLDFLCYATGRGKRSICFPSWMWRCGLAFGSVALTVLTRKQRRLVTLFEHNLNVRTYDCTQTSRVLGLDMNFDWRKSIREMHRLAPEPTGLPTLSPSGKPTAPAPASVAYYGLGNIWRQKHLPALKRMGFKGEIHWKDPVLTRQEPVAGLKLDVESSIPEGVTHAVITAPLAARHSILKSLPASVTHVLFEKPFAVGMKSFADMTAALPSGCRSYVLHNYRVKSNVLKFRKFLSEHPSGALLETRLHFDSPSPAISNSAWVRKEFQNRILLTDYAIHFVDLAWTLHSGEMRIVDLETKKNLRGELEMIQAHLNFDHSKSRIFIRQGCHQRECQITYIFQNYTAVLRFFPDVFLPIWGGRSAVNDLQVAGSSLMGIAGKVGERLGVMVTDESHDWVLASFLGMADPDIISEMSVASLNGFYQRLGQLSDEAYEERLGETSSV